MNSNLQLQVLELLKSLQKEYNLTYLFISHDLKVVTSLCHDIVVMKNGIIVEYGDPKKIFSNPERAYTKELIITAFER